MGRWGSRFCLDHHGSWPWYTTMRHIKVWNSLRYVYRFFCYLDRVTRLVWGTVYVLFLFLALGQWEEVVCLVGSWGTNKAGPRHAHWLGAPAHVLYPDIYPVFLRIEIPGLITNNCDQLRRRYTSTVMVLPSPLQCFLATEYTYVCADL